MSSGITIGKGIETGLPVHVNETLSGLQCHCICYDCHDILEAIQDSDDWHFRHSSKQNCSGNNETALHEYAMQLLFENDFVLTTKKRVNYTNPHKEIHIATFFADVSATHLEQDLYFEIVVHPGFLNKYKELYYKSSNTNCIRIDLTNPGLLKAPPEEIKYAVLENTTNKAFISEMETSSPPLNISVVPATKDRWLVALLTIVPIFLLRKKLFPGLFKKGRIWKI